jgi:hypothetical protein
MATFSDRAMPSATSTWKSQDLPTMQTAWVLALSSAERPGSLAALRPGRRVMPKATNFARLEARRIAEEGIVGRFGAGPATLDIVHTEAIECRRQGPACRRH